MAWAGRVGLRRWQRVPTGERPGDPARTARPARPLSASPESLSLRDAPGVSAPPPGVGVDRDPCSLVRPGFPSERAAGDAEVWPAGAGRFREGGRPVPGRGGIPSYGPDSSRGVAGGAPALAYRQHLSGDPSRSAPPRPDPRALWEGRAERSALLRRLHFLPLATGARGVEWCRGLVMPSSRKTSPPPPRPDSEGITRTFRKHEK